MAMNTTNMLFICFPYCIEKLKENEDGTGIWIALNREYKPIGFELQKWVKYGEYPVSFRLTKKNEEKTRALAYKHYSDRIYLYDGTCKLHLQVYEKELKQYMKRLQALAKIRIESTGKV